MIVEGNREAKPELQSRGYATTRITHRELMSHLGARYTSELFDRSYDLLWISMPLEWYVRVPGKRTTPHWQRLQRWMRWATQFSIDVVLWSAPGTHWRLPFVADTFKGLQLSTARLALVSVQREV